MELKKTSIKNVIIIKPNIFKDNRGYFIESFKQNEFENKVVKTNFIQDNESKSLYGVLRGLHYQIPPFSQSKLIRVISGKIIDVAVDIRKGSKTFGNHVAIELNDENMFQLFIPKGFAHGFVVLSKEAVINYKCDNYYSKEHERSIKFDDKTLNIDWKINKKDIILSKKDNINPLFKDAYLFNINNKLY